MAPSHALRSIGALAVLFAICSSSLAPAAGGEPDRSTRAQKAGSASPAKYIDEELRKAWVEAKVKPSPIASDAEFQRRAYLDLLGRIPSAAEASAFLTSKDPARRAKLIERLLAHPDYAKHMATVWRVLLLGRRRLDGDVDRATLESWLRRRFAANRPWNEIVRELITAKGSNRENGAVNFTLAHLGDGAVNLTSITTRVFLGQQIQCTQCHDHPSNSWKQVDFWSINAFYKGVRTREVQSADADGGLMRDYIELFDEPTEEYASFERRNAVVGIAFPAFLDGRKISQGTDVDRREALGNFVTGPENLQFARAFVNRMWGQLLGRGFVHPVDDFGEHNPPSHPELLDRLAEDFRDHGYNVKELIRWITATRAYNTTSIAIRENEKDDALFTRVMVKPMTPEQLFDSLLVATAAHRAGGDADTDRRREEWLRQFTFTFATDEETEGSSFEGTIPQALMMMNGELMARATGGQRGSFLAKVRDEAIVRGGGSPQAYMVSQLYLAALGRYPSREEMSQAAGFLAGSPDPIPVMEDLFWALLNSNEFILNH